MDGDRIQEQLEKWGAVLLVAFAVAWGISYKGFSGETLADAVKDVGAALVPIFAAMFAARLVRRDLPLEQRYLAEGERALRALQRAHPKVLQGPRYDREDYDPNEAGGKGGRYLFTCADPTAGGKDRKSSFVAVAPLAEGVVAVTVSKRNLKNLGISVDRLDEAQAVIEDAVKKLLVQPRYVDRFEILKSKVQRAAIVVDFDEESMGPKRFRAAVEAVVKEALGALLSLRVGSPPTPDGAAGTVDG